jgi:hypothetical protein
MTHSLSIQPSQNTNLFIAVQAGERARLRERERHIRLPTWSQPDREPSQSA